MVSEKIKVLFLITDLGKGGAERSITDLCLEFKKRNDIECVIGSLLPNNDFPEATENLNVVFLDYKSNSLFKKAYTPKYHKLIEDFKPHIIHSNRFLAEFLTLENLNPEIKYVCHGRDNMVQLANLSLRTFFSKKLLLNYFEKMQLVFKKYSKVTTWFVANSEHTKTYFHNVLPENIGHQITVIHNGVNYEKFSNTLNRRILKARKIKILNVGSFQEKKNQIFLVDIAHKLNEMHIDFEMNLLGEGALRKTVEERVNKGKLNNRIFFRGKTDHVEEWMRDSDIYLHTAWYEPFGIVFLEAMASGLPVVTLDGKGNRDLIINNYNGFLIDSQDSAIFASRIHQLIHEPDLYVSISENAKDFSKKFNMRDKAEEYLNFYKKILKEK